MIMTSPMRRKAQELTDAAKQPADNWLARRAETIKSHSPSIDNLMDALRDMGTFILAKRISTDLLVEEKIDIQNVRASEEIGYISCSLIPVVGRRRPETPHGLGFSWTPDVALQLNFLFRDKYDYSKDRPGSRNEPMPTGNVSLQMHTKTWGRLSEEETTQINALEHTWAEYGDRGHHRKGTSVTARREPGQVITQFEAETILAPLAPHITDYFDLVGRPDLKAHQGSGNFTSL